MIGVGPSHPEPVGDAMLACRLMALDPAGFGGILLKGPPGPARDGFLRAFRRFLPMEKSFAKVPASVTVDRLVGAVDVAATLSAGRRVWAKGLLESAASGVLLIASGERLEAEKAALMAAAMDGRPARRENVTALDGPLEPDVGFGLIVCDEGMDGEAVSPLLAERLAFWLSPDQAEEETETLSISVVSDQLDLRPAVLPDAIMAGLCGAALALGIGSARSALFAARAASWLATLAGHGEVTEAEAVVAARLVLAPRATRLPVVADPPPAEDDTPPPDPSLPEQDQDDDNQGSPTPKELAERLVAAVEAHLPEGLLARLDGADPKAGMPKPGAGSYARKAGKRRGRPVSVRRGDPRSGAKLNLIETLRAAAPWQSLRRSLRPDRTSVHIARDDFRVGHFRERRETTVIFVVDASGSAALRRMAEAKGAVELILTDCYVRRDRVALIAFRGRGADLLLPPTRSLQRARRSLADLPGGGGTPLAEGLAAAALLADQVARGGGVPLVVLLTDGRANIARDGSPDRVRAAAEAVEAGRLFRLAGHRSLMIDFSDRPGGGAAAVAEAMAAIRLPLPHADASGISIQVRNVMKNTGLTS